MGTCTSKDDERLYNEWSTEWVKTSLQDIFYVNGKPVIWSWSFTFGLDPKVSWALCYKIVLAVQPIPLCHHLALAANIDQVLKLHLLTSGQVLLSNQPPAKPEQQQNQNY